MKKKERRILENSSFKRKIIIQFLISLLIVLIVLTLVIVNNKYNLTGKIILSEQEYNGTGYAPPFDVFSSSSPKYLVYNITPDIHNFSINPLFNLTINVTWLEDVGGVVYKLALIYNSKINDWVPITLNGNLVPGSNVWLNRTGTKSILFNSSNGNFFEGANYLVAYTCRKVSGSWKCGCYNSEDTDCDHWMMQIFNISGNSMAVSSECIPNSVGTCASNEVCVNGFCVVNNSYVPPVNVVYVDSCRELNESGKTYVLTRDIDHVLDSCCFIINNGGSTFDGVGFNINGKLTSNAEAFCTLRQFSPSASFSQNFLIKNVRINNFNKGIALRLKDNITVQGSYFYNNSIGIYSILRNVVVLNSIFDSNGGYCIYYGSIVLSRFYDCGSSAINFGPGASAGPYPAGYLNSNHLIANNIFRDNYRGVILSNLANNVIINNTFDRTSSFGVYLSGEVSDFLIDNYMINVSSTGIGLKISSLISLRNNFISTGTCFTPGFPLGAPPVCPYSINSDNYSCLSLNEGNNFSQIIVNPINCS